MALQKTIDYLLLFSLCPVFIFIGTRLIDSKKAQSLLFLLILMDAVFLILNALFKGNFHIEQDRSYPEFFCYLKELALGWFLMWLSSKSKSQLLFVCSLLLFLLFFDDAFMLHENAGRQIAKLLDLSPLSTFLEVRKRDIGEIFYFLGVGFFFMGWGIPCYLKEKNPWNRDVARKLIFLIGALGFFTIGVDLMGHMQRTIRFEHLFGLADDFGEMMVLSLLTAFCVDRGLNSLLQNHVGTLLPRYSEKSP